MPSKKLPPVDVFQDKFTVLEKIIRDLLKEYLYLPLLLDLDTNQKTLTNAKESALIKALRSGRVNYYNGVFFGKMSAAISKEIKSFGGKYSPTQKGYLVPTSKIPIEYMTVISSSQISYKKTLESINKKLADLDPEAIAGQLKIEGVLDDMIFDLDAKIDQSISGITISPNLSEFELNKLKTEYQDDMERYVKDFTEKEISIMRGDIQERVFEGSRPANFTKYIEKRYGVGARKAKFLARQETRLMLATYKKAKYKSIGVEKYVWQTVAGSAKHPVRTMHKFLDGKVFDWDNPPITDKLGSRNNPGEDYNCRCVARPIIEF